MSERWSIADSAKIYNLDNWGADLFSINKKGNVCVHPSPTSKHSIDLRALMDDLIRRKIKPPVLLRFMDVLQGRIASINRVFKNAIADNEYPAKYQTFYPIKVNQQRQVVEAIANFGKRYNIGLEVGSKPELVAGISISTGNGLPIICNGYKDSEYIETVLYATKIGYDITIVVEKLFELEKIIHLSQKTGIQPKLGIRVKLSSKGTGKWATSGGEDAKFGLRMSEIIAAIQMLEKHGLVDNVEASPFPHREPDHQDRQDQDRSHRRDPDLHRDEETRGRHRVPGHRRRARRRLRRLQVELLLQRQLLHRGVRQRRHLPDQEYLRRRRRRLSRTSSPSRGGLPSPTTRCW